MRGGCVFGVRFGLGGGGGRDSMLTLYSEQGQITGLSNTVCATFDHLCMFIKQFHLALYMKANMWE